ncbi:hypothetical protein ABEY43_07375 [Priestia megaterium]
MKNFDVKVINNGKVLIEDTLQPANLKVESEGTVRFPRELTFMKSDKEIYTNAKKFVGQTVKLDVGKNVTGKFKVSLNEKEDIVFTEQL